MDGATAQRLALVGAFWIGILGFSRRRPEPSWGLRYVLGMLLAAISAHLGWAVLNVAAVREQPLSLLYVGSGYTVLAVPLGFLATAPWSEGPERRAAYLSAALGSLPFALAVARLGCLAAGCCLGRPTAAPWGIVAPGEAIARHPTALYEIAGLLLLGLSLRHVRRECVAGVVLAGLGAIRLLVEPWRDTTQWPAPLFPPSAWAALWLITGVCAWGLALQGGLRSTALRRRNRPRWPVLVADIADARADDDARR